MRRKAQETVGDSDRFALAIIDTKEQVDAEFYRLFPEFDPEVRRQQTEAEEWRRAVIWASLSPAEQAKILKEQAREEARWRRRAASARSNYGRIRENPYENVENAAWGRGRRVADKVNLRDDGEVKKQNRKGLK
jgi:hypothetical protein